ncbi:hypothetical protein [Aminipila terrae]|uniref:hypothetical protein n=1 Tax=Aminipila terrae TaxID=2697030 RepID=UPI001FABBC4A|nr:hypothetical protein [Aminipila terrae]
MVKKRCTPGAAVVLTLLLLLVAAIFHAVPLDYGTQFRMKGDINGNGVTEEYELTNSVLTIREDGKLLWKSPEGYHIDSFALGDVDNDGKDNLVISLWKKGSFGDVQPFWHKGRNKDYKNHLFVYKLEGEILKSVWCSSNLDNPIVSFTIRDADGDGNMELVVKEGEYKKIDKDKYTYDPKGVVRNTVWKWKGWGFYLEDSSKA